MFSGNIVGDLGAGELVKAILECKKLETIDLGGMSCSIDDAEYLLAIKTDQGIKLPASYVSSSKAVSSSQRHCGC